MTGPDVEAAREVLLFAADVLLPAPAEPGCDKPPAGKGDGPAFPPARVGPMGLASFIRFCVQ